MIIYKIQKNQSQINHLYEELFTDSAFSNGSTFGITLSMDDELNTQPIIHWAKSREESSCAPDTATSANGICIVGTGYGFIAN